MIRSQWMAVLALCLAGSTACGQTYLAGPGTPIQQSPVVPNTSPVAGPQYFSASVGPGMTAPVHPAANWQSYTAPAPGFSPQHGPYHQASSGSVSNPISSSATGQAAGPVGSVYGTGALYPAPQPGIPQQIGGTAIPTHALHPHEMLYAHRYKAVYPPYYYKVNGGWIVTPWGVWSKENWKLQGTTVDVKYKSHISPFAHFHRPVVR